MKIEFNTSNAAFDECVEFEVCRIIKTIIDKIEHGYTYGSIMDINGNKIGSWSL